MTEDAMEVDELLVEAYGRVQQLVHRALDGLDADGLAFRAEPGANSIAWLVWHLTRVQDDHVAHILGEEQVWADRAWVTRTGVDRDATTIGFGDGPDDVAAVRPPSPDGLLAYHDTVLRRTTRYLEGLAPADLDRIVDASYTPPVSAGVRLVSVLSDNLQHAGQALFVRGIYERTR